MELYRRRSPVKFPSPPEKKETRGGWGVVLEYSDQGKGPFLIDLSHVPKWDVQDATLKKAGSWGETIPDLPGGCVVQNGSLASRLNPTQAAVWHLITTDPVIPSHPAYTDVTDAYALIAILGKDLFSIMEKVTPLDLSTLSKTPPFLIQGPLLHVRCQTVVLDEKGGYRAVLIAFSRGYGMSMSEALLDACKDRDLRPGGETVFRDWLKEE